MNEAFDSYFAYSTETLRVELCRYNLSQFKVMKKQLEDKFKEVKEMLDIQQKVHEEWEHI